MPLWIFARKRRGQYLGMEYMEETRALLKYKLPLNEIIYDFFDALKSRSRGYASLDYELCGYERSELVKLDILVNKEEVDALSFIVHADTAYERGRKMCEKLKDEIPRQLFEIRSRQLSEARSLPERRLRLCVKMFLPSATAVIFPVRRNFWKTEGR